MSTHRLGRVHATSAILRDILTILLGLAFAGSVATFLTTDGFAPIPTTEFTVVRVLSFLCVLPTIMRFYHGNLSYLSATYSVPDHEAGLRHYGGKLAVDFAVFLVQAILFSALALYQNRALGLFLLFVSLFAIDAVWCLVNVLLSGLTFRDFEGSLANQWMRSQLNWMLANSVAADILLFPLLKNWAGGDPALQPWIPILFAVVTSNAILDYWNNRRIYFPEGNRARGRKTAFVAARFTSAISAAGFDPELRKLIESAIGVVRSHRLVVRSAHEEERFGEALARPEVLVMRDLEQIAESSIFVAIFDREESPGTFIELGWASALKKEIIILCPVWRDLSGNPMIAGLAELSSCQIVRYDGTETSLASSLNVALERALER